MSLVKHIKSEAEFQSIIRANGDAKKLVVIDFSAAWCGPCKFVRPVYQELSTQYRHVIFGEVDVDELQSVAASCGVTAMPTFQLYKNGAKIAELKGANKDGLISLIKQHQGPVDAESSVGPSGHSDLTEFVNVSQIECLNQSTQHSVKNAFTKGPAYLESDVDEQLILNIPFQSAVKLHSIKIIAPKDSAPKTVKTYINRLALSFDEVDSVQETECLEFTESDYTENDAEIKNLRFVRYQNVNNIILFIQDNLTDADTTVIQQIVFYGTPLDATKDVSQLKAIGEQH